MAMSRIGWVCSALLSCSVLFLFYLGSQVTHPARLRQPAITPDTAQAWGDLGGPGGERRTQQRSLKTGTPLTMVPPLTLPPVPEQKTTKDIRTKEAEKEEKAITAKKNSLLGRKENMDPRPNSVSVHGVRRVPHPKRKAAPASIFSLKDYRPGQFSAPVKYGLASALARLNLEFASEQDAITANTLRVVPRFQEANANVMEVVGAGVRVGQQVPVESARQILVATTWRSGSTFLGDLLNHYPGTFYFFEPLHYYSHVDKAHREQVVEQADFLSSLYHCNFNDNIGFLRHVTKSENKFLFKNHNKRLWNSCYNLLPQEAMCVMPEYLNRMCPLYPIKLIKTVRLRVAKVEKMLQDPSMDLKVILLVRDPRGVYNSRSSGPVSTWCVHDMCTDPSVGCADLMADVTAAEDLASRYPGSVTLVRYEDLSMMPEDTTRDLLKFLDLPWTKTMSTYIDTHTSKEKMRMVRNKVTKKLERRKDTYGTAKNSTATAFAWLQKLSFAFTSEIQSACQEPMQRLGYRLLASEEDMLAQDLPLEKTAEEVWPSD